MPFYAPEPLQPLQLADGRWLINQDLRYCRRACLIRLTNKADLLNGSELRQQEPYAAHPPDHAGRLLHRVFLARIYGRA